MMKNNKAFLLIAVLALLLSGCGRAEIEQSSDITEASGVSDISYESEASEEADLSEAFEESEVSEESDVSDAVGEGVTYEYNDEGKPIREFHRDADGNLEYYREFSYSVKGLYHITAYAPDGKQLGMIDYIYNGNRLEKAHEFDADNNVIKIMFYNQEGNVDHYTEYLRDGGEIIEVSRRADGTLLASFESLYSEGYYSFLLMSEYDENGAVTAKTVLAHDLGDRSVVVRYEYDESGREVKYTAMGGMTWSETVYYYVREYDGGLLSVMTWYDYHGVAKLRREFGSDGRAVKDMYLNDDGSVDSYAVHGEWNDEDQPLKAKLYDPNDKLIGKIEYIYGEDGSLECENTYDLGGHKIKERTFTYERYDRLQSVDEKRFDKNGLTTYSISCCYASAVIAECEYNDTGNPIKSTACLLDGSFADYALCDYHENGNPKKKLHYDANGELMGEIDYDINGNETESASYNDGSYYGGSTYEYNAEGFLIKETRLDSNKNVQWSCEHKYIETDGIRSKTEYNADGQKVCYIEYAEDGDGNWKEAHRYEYKDGEIICHTVMEEVDGITIYNVYDANGELVRKYYYDESGYCGTPIIIQ